MKKGFFLGAALSATTLCGELPANVMFFMKPEVTLPLSTDEFKIDGRIDDIGKMALSGAFLSFGVNPVPDDRVKVFMACRQNGIYIGVRVAVDGGAAPRAVSTERDEGSLWTRDDAIEIQGTFNGADYNFIGNFAGVKGDRKDGKAAWNDDNWQFAASCNGEVWECEFLLPAATFGLKQFSPGDSIQMDVFNNNRSNLQSGLAFRAGRWHFPRTYWPQFNIGAPGSIYPRLAEIGELGNKRIGLKLEVVNPSAVPAKVKVWAAFYKALPDKEENYFSQISGLYNDKEVALKPGATQNELIHHVLKPLLRDNYVLTELIDKEEEIAPGAAYSVEIRKPAMPGYYLAAYQITDASGKILAAMVQPVIRSAPLTSRLDYYYTTGKRVVANVKMPMSSPPDRIVCRILDQEKVITESAVKGGNVGETLSVPLSTASMRPGKYVLSVEGFRNNNLENSFRQEFEKPADPDWLNSNAGKEDFVPYPWNPVQATADSAIVWGREISWNDTVFPASIISQGIELLAAPLALEGVAGGEKIIWNKHNVFLTAKTDSYALYTLNAEAAALRLNATVRIEYDGMVRFDLKISGGGKVKLEQLNFDVPIRAEVAKYFKRDENLGLQSRNLVPREWEKKYPDWALLGGKSWTMPFTPALVLRNEHVGLEWFAEWDKDWNNTREDTKIEIRSGEDREILRIRLVDKALELTGELSYTFGLMPWPVRPWPEKRAHVSQYLKSMDHREIEDLKRVPFESSWLYDQDLHRFLGKDEEAIRSNIAQAKQAGMDVLWVFHWNHYRDPAGKFYHPCEHMELFNEHMRKRVERLGSLAKEAQVKIMGHVGYGVAPTNHDFKYYSHELASHPIDNKGAWGYKYSPAGCMRDLYSHRAREFASKYNWNGIQLDGTYMLRYDECEHTGVGVRDINGKLKGRFPIFAYRELAERLYKIYNGKPGFPTPDGRGFVYVHTDGYACGPVVSFCDAIHAGEEPQSMNAKHLDQLDFKREWTRYPTRALGLPFEWLPKMGSAPVGNAGRIATALQLGMSMPAYRVLDGLKANDYRKTSYPVDRLWAAFEWAGAGKDNFVRADESQELVSVSSPKVMTALYYSKNRVLLALTNLNRENVEIQVAPDCAKLGLKGDALNVVDAITGEKITNKDARFNLNINADSYRLVKIYSTEKQP